MISKKNPITNRPELGALFRTGVYSHSYVHHILNGCPSFKLITILFRCGELPQSPPRARERRGSP